MPVLLASADGQNRDRRAVVAVRCRDVRTRVCTPAGALHVDLNAQVGCEEIKRQPGAPGETFDPSLARRPEAGCRGEFRADRGRQLGGSLERTGGGSWAAAGRGGGGPRRAGARDDASIPTRARGTRPLGPSTAERRARVGTVSNRVRHGLGVQFQLVVAQNPLGRVHLGPMSDAHRTHAGRTSSHTEFAVFTARAIRNAASAGSSGGAPGGGRRRARSRTRVR